MAGELRKIGSEIFKAAGVPEDEANLVSDFLVKANLDGHDSHGVIRIPQYVKEIEEGRIKPRAEFRIIRETATSALIDGNWGFGQVVAERAMRIAIEKARAYTVGIVSVRNCNHVGRLFDYTVMAAEEGMIGLAFVNSPKIVAPYGGIDRKLGTCPISLAFPAGENFPIVIDMATSVCAEGKVRVALHKGMRLPYRCIVDKWGRLSDDPKDLYDGGALLPFGGEVGYKGFGLALSAEILGGILSGTGFSSSERFRGGNGVFMEVINVDGFMDADEFRREVDNLIRAVKSSRVMHGFKEIIIPGEIEFRTRVRRVREGIKLPDETWKRIVETARRLGLDIKSLLK